ncbi:MAG: CpsD/CapB family tyrosine-protein kinase [Bryobacteraceae bacterium]
MSRNFELMREIEQKQALLANYSVEPALTAGKSSGRGFPRSLASDLMAGLVERIFLQPQQKTPRMVVFAAIDHGSGCSQIAASVARALTASAPGAVCLVEANFRSPALPRMLGTTNYQGFTDALLQRGSIRSFMKPMGNGCLWLLSSGPVAADSPNLLAGAGMRARFVELRAEFHFVIVDAPPLSRYADAIALGQLSDGMVLILEAGSTRQDAAITAVRSVRSSRVQVLGAVLNKETSHIRVEEHKEA